MEIGDREAALTNSKEVLKIAGDTDLRSEAAFGYLTYAYVLADFQRFTEAIEAYQKSVEIHESLGEEKERVFVLTKLAEAHVQTGDLSRAEELVDIILEYLKKHDYQGFDQPVRIFLICYRILTLSRDPRADMVLEEGYHILTECAEKFEEELARQSFIYNVPLNRELLEAWQGRRVS